MSFASITGHVSLVGAGPGDPELMTVKAARLLAEADAVVYDALVGRELLDLARWDAELFDVGKTPGAGVPQEFTNDLLVRLATEGKRIVRLKGGDPFVFGRGGEEAIVLAAAGISCEIVPGITSAVAGPAAAGIPVTFRGVSASFTVVTGHRQRGEIPVNWRALAQAGGTIVVLMGVSERAAIAAELIAGGMARDTPVAAIHRATTDRQTVVRCRIDKLAVTAVDSPAILVIGAVAALDVTDVAAIAATDSFGRERSDCRQSVTPKTAA